MNRLKKNEKEKKIIGKSNENISEEMKKITFGKIQLKVKKNDEKKTENETDSSAEASTSGMYFSSVFNRSRNIESYYYFFHNFHLNRFWNIWTDK